MIFETGIKLALFCVGNEMINMDICETYTLGEFHLTGLSVLEEILGKEAIKRYEEDSKLIREEAHSLK